MDGGIVLAEGSGGRLEVVVGSMCWNKGVEFIMTEGKLKLDAMGALRNAT
jgi:hypothetical protein